jgi:signal transduction histidine kinase
MSYFVLAPAFGAFVNLVLAVFVLSRAPRQRLNQVHFIWGISLVVWCSGACALFFIHTAAVALAVAKILWCGVFLIPASGLHFAALLCGKKRSRWIGAGYLATVAFCLLNLSGHFLKGVWHTGYAWYGIAGPACHLFGLFTLICSTRMITLAVRHRRTSAQKKKYTAVLIGYVLLAVSGIHDFLPTLGYFYYPGTAVHVYPWGTYCAGIYGSLIAYAALQDQLLDVRIALSRYAATFVRLVFFFAIAFLLLFLIASFFPVGGFPLNAFNAALGVMIAAGTISALLFPRLFGGATETLERELLGDTFEYQQQLASLAEKVFRHTEVASLWQEVSEVLSQRMHVRPIHLFVLRGQTTLFRDSLPYSAKSRLYDPSSGSLLPLLAQESSGYLDVRQQMLTWPVENDAHRQARIEAESLDAEFVFAIPSSRGIAGFLTVGSKPDQPFTRTDIKLLRRLTQRMGWTIERTLLSRQVIQAEKHELVATMSRGLAHDLHNLITPIHTLIQITAKRPVERPSEQKLLRAAQDSLDVIRAYVSETLFLAKEMKLNRSQFNVSNLIDDAHRVVTENLERKNLQIEKLSDQSTLVADAVLCQRLIVNLLGNAIEASSSGALITISASSDVSRGVTTLKVRDTGCGIPAELQRQVFTPYFTTKTGEQGSRRGLGLGLTVCQMVVELHQGSIAIDSEIGRGTTFIVELPTAGPEIDILAEIGKRSESPSP